MKRKWIVLGIFLIISLFVLMVLMYKVAWDSTFANSCFYPSTPLTEYSPYGTCINGFGTEIPVPPIPES